MKKRILVAPLHWGIGHACRCIPIIYDLLHYNFEVIIASDHDSLSLLKKEFPDLTHIQLPGYKVSYAKKKRLFKFHLLKQLPTIYKAIKEEHVITQEIIKTYKIDGIISDNRLGVYSKKVQSVFVTHQLNVMTGTTSFLSTKLHAYFINKFDFCWIPDFNEAYNLSGSLGHSSTKNIKIPISYVGALSRFSYKKESLIYDILIVLSGPEPQREFLETQLRKVFINSKKTVLMVKGNVEEKEQKYKHGHFSEINFLTTSDLEKAINQSQLVIARSGYTSIMDFAKLNKKVFFIPTPGQFEQNYLAKHLKKQHIAPFCQQDDFNINQLEKLKNYSGFGAFNFKNRLSEDLFRCFL